MDLGLHGRRVAVAAGTAGLGRACAAALRAEGAQVVLCGSDEGRARTAGEELGADWTVADLTDPEAAAGFVTEATERLGGLDVLVVNGPGPRPGRVADTALDDYRAALDRSLLAVVGMCQAAVPTMAAQGWGRIVAITSLGVRQPYPNLALSNTARAGATGFLRTLAREVAAQGVTVNSVLPGLHDTARVRGVYTDPDALSSALAGVPAGRLGTPEECAALVAFLCSELAGFVTGAAIPVDGGAYAGLL
ncbi:SDR family oxidoreductase [Actinomycetospora corticicola]|uniref:3-oxoacyl-[acyl-carrier protein] reductase n=1 Tax=Actinomycetospora corticicola TaxID=663602 RepID=A0A7Y9J3Y0_9PSEU|nr:SDR family oxidoreductase [Actinomycetospora corticicola]NYD34465.1 3-oxoacyl-[acyl-carrier protein] reductase [Actinomycetospora corticicola]